jgi:O-antigen ligase
MRGGWADLPAYLALVYVLACFCSITAAQVTLGLMALVFLLQDPRWIHRGLQVFPRTHGLWSLVLVGWAVVTATWALEPTRAWHHLRKLMFWVPPVLLAALVARYGTSFRKAWLYALTLGGVITSGVGWVQYLWVGHGTLERRVTGLLSHYMTLGGLLSVVFLLLVAQVWVDRFRWSLAGAAVLTGTVLVLSLTRSAWLGTLAGLTVLASLRGWQRAVRLVLACGALAGAVFWFAPPALSYRLEHFFSPSEVSNRMRLWLWEMGLRVVWDHPWFGTGPDQMPYIYDNYRLPAMPEGEVQAHFHDNLLQMAVERGLPGLGIWLGWYISGLQWLRVRYRQVETPLEKALAAGLLAAWVSLGVAGLFEYNFGDSEVLMLWLTLPAWVVPEGAAGEEVGG